MIETERTHSIGDAARLSGFPAATLRYYDELGLVSPASRTGAGYRRYTDRDLERLRFVEHAKQLDCSLDEIGELLVAWDGGECGPLQDRLRTVVAAKIADAQSRLGTLSRLMGDLHHAAAALERHRPVGACDDECGCSASTDPVPVAIACSLKPGELVTRQQDFAQLLDGAVARQAIAGGVRVEFDAVDVAALATLVTAEQACCPFWEFALTIDARGVGLEVRGPEGTGEMLGTLFGVPA